MSLAFELTRIPGSDYLPRPEFIDKAKYESINWESGNIWESDNIWDILGEYHPNIGTIVLYEDTIVDFAHWWSTTSNWYPILRELVRAHEHAHAYIHTASLYDWEPGSTLKIRDWFDGLPNDIHESLAEHIVVCILESGRWPPAWRRFFDEVNSHSPSYYRKWKRARRLRRGYEYITPTLRFARTKIWKDWNEFYEALAEEQDKITAEAVLLRLKG